MTVKQFQSLDDTLIEHIDQFIYRFSKMQDSMGRRLLPALYSYLESDTSVKPFLDILNRLEKIGVITSGKDWQFFRNLRNNLAHDYPAGIQQTVDTLNILMERIDTFIDIFITVKTRFERLDQKE